MSINFEKFYYWHLTEAPAIEIANKKELNSKKSRLKIKITQKHYGFFQQKNPDFEGGSWMKIWKPIKFFISRKMVGGGGVNQSDFTGFSIFRASLTNV